MSHHVLLTKNGNVATTIFENYFFIAKTITKCYFLYIFKYIFTRKEKNVSGGTFFTENKFLILDCDIYRCIV